MAYDAIDLGILARVGRFPGESASWIFRPWKGNFSEAGLRWRIKRLEQAGQLVIIRHGRKTQCYLAGERP